MPQIEDDKNNEAFSKNEKARLFLTLDQQTNQLKRLELGMFGDKDLQIAGVREDVVQLKADMWQVKKEVAKIPELVEDNVQIKAWISNGKTKLAMLTGAAMVIIFFAKSAWTVFSLWLDGKRSGK